MRMVEEVVANRRPMPIPESRGTTPAPSSGYNSTAASTPPVNASPNRVNNSVRPARPPPGKTAMSNQMPVPNGQPRRGSGTPQPVRPVQAQGTGFYDTCADLFSRAINTVPDGVQLSASIEAMKVKPYNVSFDFGSDGKLELSGNIRVIRAIDYEDT